ncbi:MULTISPECIES: fibronectin type III-like domain-contianing protein [unclassified Paenibacillus]|uniref:fibronectin type III-like domain-contianing protein n=1 Tax=unclassified Paenibacillus TaxID=185978 RepID=UPI00237959A6|nr:fibronectin type III-like domain-contianing protein [Paenibacillus sp. MAHUQ-63]
MLETDSSCGDTVDILRLSSQNIKEGDLLTVSVDIRNVGKRTGKEVVQVYVSDILASIPKAVKELKGFSKIELAPGKTKSVEIELKDSDFSHYVEHLGKFAVESGEFQILVGSSSRDIRLRESVVCCRRRQGTLDNAPLAADLVERRSSCR